MAQKTKSKPHTLLVSMVLFIMITIGLAFLGYEIWVPPFWFTFAYFVAWILVFGFGFDYFVIRAKFSRKKALLLTFGIIIMSITVTHSVWAIITPRWSFSVTTDKNTYRLGENVTITVTLENHGLITHSFKSSISDPVVVRIRTSWYHIWYTPSHYNITEFTISPNQPLERTFVWNQTNIYHPEKENEPNKYYVHAHIPSSFAKPPFDYPIFQAGTSINITST